MKGKIKLTAFLSFIILVLVFNCASASKQGNIGNGEKNTVSVVMEGDSWLDYPFAKDLHDTIKEKYFKTEIDNKQYIVDYNVVSAGHAGDELLKMVIEFEFIKLVNKKIPDLFLLSGGGNDLLNKAVLSSIIKTNTNICEQKDKTHIDCFVNQKKLERRIEIIIAGIKIIANELQDIFEENKAKFEQDSTKLSIPREFKTIPLFVHGYDYINVKKEQENCPFLQRIFFRCQWLYPVVKDFDPEIQRKIAKHLIDEFNKALKKLSEDQAFKDKVFYIDLRETLGNEIWSDEIHPSTKGFQALSNKINANVIETLHKKWEFNIKTSSQKTGKK